MTIGLHTRDMNGGTHACVRMFYLRRHEGPRLRAAASFEAASSHKTRTLHTHDLGMWPLHFWAGLTES